jgi:hypothetical protein
VTPAVRYRWQAQGDLAERVRDFSQGTGNTTVAALCYQDVNLFSDMALHQMGLGLADYIHQGQANGDEFCTAPLWDLGQRIFPPNWRGNCGAQH